jgi:hypothetical protein
MPDELDALAAPVDLLVPVPPGDGGQAEWQVAASVHLPAREALAHMHNFSANRTLLWDRLEEFTAHVARIIKSGYGPV